jgi:hypothetical protein
VLSRRARVTAIAACAAIAGSLAPVAAARATAPPQHPSAEAHGGCPVLVLSAMPLEIAPILSAATVNPTPVWVHGGKGFWSGRVEGNKAILAITGIGLQNATLVTQAAFEHFACFSAVVFSGTSGGDFIGDVMVPARWTEDGTHFTDTSSTTLAVLQQALQKPIALEQSTPVGNPLCPCGLPVAPTATLPLTVEHKPQVEVGGNGLSNDGFGGRALPCTPQASDVLGCWPCPFPDTAAPTQATNLASTVPPFLQPQFFLGYQAASAAPPGTYVSSDEETAAVFSIVARHGVPFIGFRAASDGTAPADGGDPLMLPGFPAQFFVYRQLAADNAAGVALAFLRAWHADES